MGRKNTQNKTKTQNTLITKQNIQNNKMNIKRIHLQKQLIRTKQRAKMSSRDTYFIFEVCFNKLCFIK
jgi:hypothetical protein